MPYVTSQYYSRRYVRKAMLLAAFVAFVIGTVVGAALVSMGCVS